MRIINIIDNASKLNYGIWHAVIINAKVLKLKGISTELWYHSPKDFESVEGVVNIHFESSSIDSLASLSIERNLCPSKDIIVTHGCWRFPTRWGAYLRGKGFAWIYVPHGMLELWALQQKKIKKLIYFYFFEKRMVLNADAIRAVSLPEKKNLETLFVGKRIEFIPNGVTLQREFKKPFSSSRQYLFLSRLHPKKNVLSLAKAWMKSSLNNDARYLLLIAGPDQGDLPKLESFIKASRNIKYIGSIYGNEKNEILNSSTFYVLPSYSEGLPSSLLEAMAFGLVPIITEECNLPEAFTSNLAIKINPDEESIAGILEKSTAWSDDKIAVTASECKKFIDENYSLDKITEKQAKLVSSLLPGSDNITN